jgi:tetratricopeptide (TPR) repeat protein
VFLAGTVTAASIGWAARDRAARAAEILQAETARRATVGTQVRVILNTARTLIAENKLPAAREKLAQAGAQLGNDGSALGDLAAEVEAAKVELDRLQQFLDLIDRAHQAETAPRLEGTLAADGSHGCAATPAPVRTGDRRPAVAVPFLLEALRRYGVLERDDWNTTLGGGLLGSQQVEQIRRLVYEELLWLVDDVFHRQQEHGSGRKLSAEAATRQALVYLDKAESAHPPTRLFYAMRYRCRNDLGDEAAAKADKQRAVQTPATMALDHFPRGRAAHDAKKLAEGVQAFEAALRLEPTHYWSLMWLGYCLCDLGQGPEDFAGAARVFTGCILHRPDHAHAYYCRANAYAKLRQYDKAIADYSQALQLDPTHAAALCGRGCAYNNSGQPAIALDDESRAIDLDPKSVQAWCNRGIAFNKLGQPNRALADLSRAIDLDPKFAPAWKNRGDAYDDLRQYDKAVADYSQALDLDPKYALAWKNRGDAYDDLRQYDKASADYSQAVDLDPKLESAWLNRGAAHVRLGQLDKAVADFTQVIELDRKSASAWFNRGVAYADWGQPDKAVADLTKTIELAPDDPQLVQAYLSRAIAHSRLGQYEQARTDYQAFLKREPTHHGAHNALAWLLAICPDAKLRDPDQAVALATKAVQLAPKEATYWNTLGVAHYRAGDWKAAVAALDKVRELSGGGDVGNWLFLAMAHWKLGNHDEALKMYKQAAQWLEKKLERLPKEKGGHAEQLRDFWTEAEEVLELKKK